VADFWAAEKCENQPAHFALFSRSWHAWMLESQQIRYGRL
jgi:hypothetical protein